jgi:hypothetical protein
MLFPGNLRYRSLNHYLRERFGEKVYKVSIDAGFDCPNRDGTLASGGCTYCDEGSRAPGVNPALSIRDQLLQGMERMRRRYKARKFIAYFQAFTNTYARTEVLRERYSQALGHPDVVGLSVSTRPDTLSEGAIELLDEIAQGGLVPQSHPERSHAWRSEGSPFELWLELGLQTIHDKTNERLNRWHTYRQFENALFKAKKKPSLKICTHLILGLPQETTDEMHETIDTLVKLPIDGLKIHLLHLIKNTKLYEDYLSGGISLFEEDEHVNLVCDLLEKIPSRIIIHRLTGDAAPDKLIAPRWALEKAKVLREINETLQKRESYQGMRAASGFAQDNTNPSLKSPAL